METLSDWSAVQRAVGGIRRVAPEYSTNFYATPDQFARWSASTPLTALQTRGALLVLRADRDFRRVYHVAEDRAVLTAALELLPRGSYVTDLIGQSEALQAICAAYAAAGFTHRGFLARMSRAQASSRIEAENALLGTQRDVPEVMAFMERLLDRFTEQLPEETELREAADRGHLLIIRLSSEVAGMLMYDVKGQLAHLRFWHVDPHVHGRGVGGKLMASFLARCAEMRRIVLWVVGDNDRSMAIYRHYGFATDGLLDRVMILHKGL